jgi:glycine/D-amino acid oxidase-like deaminating enzyme
VAWLRDDAQAGRELGHDTVFLDRDEVRAEVDSPTYLAGSWHRDQAALVDPARLAWGLREACIKLGVRMFENTEANSLEKHGAGVRIKCVSGGSLRARRVALGTNAFPALLRRLRPFTVPVYDYVLMTEPLSAAQHESIGWRNRQGIGDSANQFHYYRLTQDNRILWGGYDAIYHWGNGLHDHLDQRPETFELLARQFFDTFPQLEGLRFSHKWGGAIPGHRARGTSCLQSRLHRTRCGGDALRRASHARSA